MKLDLAYNIFDILQTMIEAVKQMAEEYKSGNIETFNALCLDLWDGLTVIQETVKTEKAGNDSIRLDDACICALESLKTIEYLCITSSNEVLWKIECELLTIVESMALQFFYWAIVTQNPNERNNLYSLLQRTGRFDILQQSEEERKYSCDLTIWVTAYNHLEYTKMCVESILENWPKGISAELILYNHGSSDGTRKYFEGIPNAKVYNVAINRAVPSVAPRSQSGKYILSISNDIIVGKNAIDNMYRAIVDNPQYGWAVPTTPNISNCQNIPAEYSSYSQMKEFMKANNIYDVRRHEERVRLCNPLQIMRADIMFRHLFEEYEANFCNMSIFSFPDDKCSTWLRRQGYKSVLLKDAYCHHFGSVTLKTDLGNAQEKKKFYLEGRNDFRERYGVDPWGTGACFDIQLFQNWDIPILDNATILGINCGLGSNSLKVKEVLKEQGAQNVSLINCTQEENYLLDLQGISDEAYLIENLSDIVKRVGKNQFTFVVIDDFVRGIEEEKQAKALADAGVEYDQLAIRQTDGKWIVIKNN